jgi:glycosyltransferase involved in cell wall biosynthesis
MSVRVSYWTGWLDPQMVAVSKEVFQLMGHFPRSWAIGISPNYTLVASYARRSFGVHPRFYPLFRPLIRSIEQRFDISHVYTGLGDWHFLNALGQRPIVLTLTQNGKAGHKGLLDKVSHVVAESEQLADHAVASGVAAERVSVIRPGVDLQLFRPVPPPPTPWRCLFASSPENLEEIHTKGVDLLLELARARPAIQITMLWRPFGAASDEALHAVQKEGLSNVNVVRGRVEEIEKFYQSHHFTIAPFRTVGKPCPNSILEGLACGRPALVSEFSHIGELLEREGAGLTFRSDLNDLVCAVDRLTANYEEFPDRSRRCAELHFDVDKTVDAYRRLYCQLLRTPVATDSPA